MCEAVFERFGQLGHRAMYARQHLHHDATIQAADHGRKNTSTPMPSAPSVPMISYGPRVLSIADEVIE